MRKSLYIIFLLIILLVTSCQVDNRKENQNLEGPQINEDEGGEGGKDISDDEDLEPDINYIDIEEDKELTEKALENGAEKQDVTLMEKDMLDELDTDDIVANLNSANIIEKYNDDIPNELEVDLQYREYSMPITYLLITKDQANIYKEPKLDSESLGKAQLYSKVKLVSRVKGEYVEDVKSDEWYTLAWMEEGKTVVGYVTKDTGEPREFRFKDMVEHINNLNSELNETKYGYISNYKDRNGSPPLMNGKGIDMYGIQAYQSAPAYTDLQDKTKFRYIPDGMIVFILDENGEYYKVKNLVYEGEYWVPKKYISFEDNIDTLDKVVVIDVKNQNEGVFEKQGDQWNIISYTLATTGAKEQYKFETPRGYFKVLEKKERFQYLDDKTREVAGYAPYGTRFTAGAYIHGVPVAYEKKDGKNVDPGIKEYLFTIGTTPRSHKCVRNYTSHARFIYDWAQSNNTAVIVFE